MSKKIICFLSGLVTGAALTLAAARFIPEEYLDAMDLHY